MIIIQRRRINYSMVSFNLIENYQMYDKAKQRIWEKIIFILDTKHYYFKKRLYS